MQKPKDFLKNLIKEYQEKGFHKEKLVRINDELCKQIAMKFSKSYPGIEYDDFLQEARIAVLKSIRQYNVDSDYPFKGYVKASISNACSDLVREMKFPIKIPRGSNLSDTIFNLSNSIRQLPDREQYDLSQLAEILNTTEENVSLALAIHRSPVPLDNEHVSDGFEENDLLDTISINQIIDSLSDKNKMCLTKLLRGVSVKEISEQEGVTSQAISMRLKRLKKIR